MVLIATSRVPLKSMPDKVAASSINSTPPERLRANVPSDSRSRAKSTVLAVSTPSPSALPGLSGSSKPTKKSTPLPETVISPVAALREKVKSPLNPPSGVSSTRFVPEISRMSPSPAPKSIVTEPTVSFTAPKVLLARTATRPPRVSPSSPVRATSPSATTA